MPSDFPNSTEKPKSIAARSHGLLNSKLTLRFLLQIPTTGNFRLT